MAEKKYTDEYVATSATSLTQKAAYHGTGRVIIADLQFRPLKTAAIALMKCGLYSNILVKKVQKGFPRKLLNKTDLSRGEWIVYKADVKGVKVQVNNLKVNDIIRSVNIILVIP